MRELLWSKSLQGCIRTIHTAYRQRPPILPPSGALEEKGWGHQEGKLRNPNLALITGLASKEWLAYRWTVGYLSTVLWYTALSLRPICLGPVDLTVSVCSKPSLHAFSLLIFFFFLYIIHYNRSFAGGIRRRWDEKPCCANLACYPETDHFKGTPWVGQG